MFQPYLCPIVFHLGNSNILFVSAVLKSAATVPCPTSHTGAQITVLESATTPCPTLDTQSGINV